MAVKGAMPLDLQNLILGMDDLDALKNFLIKVFDNPRMKQTYGKKGSRRSRCSRSILTDDSDRGTTH